jgi:uncharacterized membrane protein YgaE (UPF0421/DUF939 family)
VISINNLAEHLKLASSSHHVFVQKNHQLQRFIAVHEPVQLLVTMAVPAAAAYAQRQELQTRHNLSFTHHLALLLQRHPTTALQLPAGARHPPRADGRQVAQLKDRQRQLG